MDRRGRLQTHSTPDRCGPAPSLRRRMGVPQETVVPRNLDLLRHAKSRAVIPREARTTSSPTIFTAMSPSFWLVQGIYAYCPKLNSFAPCMLLRFDWICRADSSAATADVVRPKIVKPKDENPHCGEPSCNNKLPILEGSALVSPRRGTSMCTGAPLGMTILRVFGI